MSSRDRAIKRAEILMGLGFVFLAAFVGCALIGAMPLAIGACVAATASFLAVSLVCIKAGANV